MPEDQPHEAPFRFTVRWTMEEDGRLVEHERVHKYSWTQVAIAAFAVLVAGWVMHTIPDFAWTIIP